MSTTPSAEVQAEIRAMLDTWAKATASRNADLLLSLFADDMQYLAPNLPPISSKAEMRTLSDGMLRAAPNMRMEFPHVSFSCDANAGAKPGVVWIVAQQRIFIEGQTEGQDAHGVGVFVRGADGQFKIAMTAVVQAAAPLLKIMDDVRAAYQH